MRRACLILFLAVPFLGTAQPFVDLFTLNHMESPGSLQRSEITATLPVLRDTVGHLLLLDPYAVRWEVRTPADRYLPALDRSVNEDMAGYGLPITYVTPLGKRGVKLAAAGILRYHYLSTPDRGAWQPGAALLVGKGPAGRSWKVGVYLNHDAFGWFMMPLLGMDLRWGTRDRLFGLLPGALTYEHKVGRAFRCGISFRAYTSSFGTREGDFRRIDENPLGVFGDVYITRNVVLRAEAGRTFLRQVRGGPGDPVWRNPREVENGYADHHVNDDLYFRVMLAFRLRLDE